MFAQIPKIYRHIEQRVGRIVRMNSSFREVHIVWPHDAREFTVTTDKRAFRTAEDVKVILGSNLDPPDELREEPVTIDDEYARKVFAEQWERLGDGQIISDAFEPIRSLVYGPTAIIPPDVYDAIRKTDVTVVGSLKLRKVGAVRAHRPFVFATVLREHRAPGFHLWMNAPEEVVVDALATLMETLRRLIKTGQDHRKSLSEAGPLIEHAYTSFRAHRREMLSNRQQRALRTFQAYYDYLSAHKKTPEP